MFPSKFFSRTLLAQCMTLAALAMLFALPAQAANNCDVQQGGIGGTGAAVEHGGIGGTGNLAQGSGMGGTGAIAQDSGIGGTGITGIITGFASICVNGMEVHYDSNTPLEINGQPATANDLAVGQLVYAEATGTGDEVVARKISVRYAVSGPVTHVSNGNGQIRVMGQTVQLTGQTINSMGGVQPGDFVRVSGLRKQDGVVMAARVERAAAQNEVSVSGPISRTGKREFNISGLRIAPEGGKMPEGLATGREVHVRGLLKDGLLKDGLLKAEKIEVAPALPFGGREQRLELQGYVRATREDGKLRVGETQMEISPQAMTGGKPAPDQLVRVSARLTPDKRVVVEHIEPVRSYFERKESHSIKREGERRSAKDAEYKDTGSRRTENRHDEGGKSADRDHRTLRENTERSGKPEEGSHRPHKREVERHERSERMERTERAERSERAERIERAEIPERVERIEKIELPEKIERIETPERVERIERVERPDSH